MSTAYVVTALVTIAFNTFSGFAAMTRLKPIMRTLGPALGLAVATLALDPAVELS